MIGKKEDLVFSSLDYVDNVGKSYPDGYSIYYDGAGNKDREVTFLLEKEYTKLTGTIALRSGENDIRDGVWLEFYDGKNNLIGKTEHLYAGVLPVDVYVDISGVDRLKVKANGGNQFAFILTSGFYLE